MRFLLATLAGALLLAPAAAAPSALTPLPMPAPAANAAAVPYAELEATVSAFNRHVGTWPPSFASEAERQAVYQRWSAALQQAWALQARQGASEDTLYLLAELYRQGHNMEVSDAGSRANTAVQSCLQQYPDSVRCHFSASFFYLTIDPQFAPQGEASLLRLRALLAPRVDMTVERGFVFAYLYQGRQTEALAQLDYLLRLDPSLEWAHKLRAGLQEGPAHIKRQ